MKRQVCDPYSFDKCPRRPEDVSADEIVGVCASMKPGRGENSRSASRGLLSFGLSTVHRVYPRVSLLDLRDHPLPLFDGRMPSLRPDADVRFVSGCMVRAGALWLSVPAYWSGVSGVFKNFVDVLCGPAYEQELGATVFVGKPVGILVVGADARSARAAEHQAAEIMTSTGAVVLRPIIVVENPRARGDVTKLSESFVTLGAALARKALERGGARG